MDIDKLKARMDSPGGVTLTEEEAKLVFATFNICKNCKRQQGAHHTDGRCFFGPLKYEYDPERSTREY